MRKIGVGTAELECVFTTSSVSEVKPIIMQILTEEARVFMVKQFALTSQNSGQKQDFD